MPNLETVKKFLLADLALGLIITGTLWNSVGTEGMAAEYCSLTHAEMCDDVEWSEANAEKVAKPERPAEAPGHKTHRRPHKAWHGHSRSR